LAETTAIEWTDATWNPFQGCTKVDQDCKFCYMYREKDRYGQDPTTLVRSKAPTFNAPLNAAKFPPGSLVFTASWSDWGHPAAAPNLRDAWAVVAKRPDLTFQILTKRPERIPAILPATWGPEGWSNVWLGTSVGSPKGAHRAKLLAEVPAVVRFLSLEPLWAGGVATAVRDVIESGRIDWIILGGESGPSARPMHPTWAQGVIEIAEASGVPVLFKQWGEWVPICAMTEDQLNACYRSNRSADSERGERQEELDEAFGRTLRVPRLILRTDGVHREIMDPLAFRSDHPGWPAMLAFRVGKKAAGRTIGGRLLDGYPNPRPGGSPI
jgi:protein gp37